MLITITGPDSGFLGDAFFNEFDDVDVDIVGSPSPTQFTVENQSTGAITIINGSGFSFSPSGEPTGGTIFDMAFEDGFGAPVATITGLGWDLVAFNDALAGVERGDFVPIAALFNASPLITFDGSGMSDRLDLIRGWDELLERITVDIAVTGSAYGDELTGSIGEDTIDPGNNDTSRYWDEYILASPGDDLLDLSATGQTTNVWIDYGMVPGGLTAQIDGLLNTGTIMGPGFTDTLFDPRAAMQADGLGIGGSVFDDDFTVNNLGGGWFSLLGDAGHDSYTLDLGGDARLNFHRGSDFDPFTGLILDLGTGLVAEDGHGFSDLITLSGTGRLEIRATDHNDSLLGSDRDDSFITEQGDDTVDGAGGFDRLRYDRSGVGPVFVDLEANTAMGTWDGMAFVDTLFSIEEVRGSRTGDDTLLGSAADERLRARDGNDRLEGRGGDDTLIGGAGDDTLIGGGGNDALEGGDGDDLIDASQGLLAEESWGDYIRPGAGANTILGHAGLYTSRGDGIDISYVDVMGSGGLVITVGADGTGTAVSNAAGVVNDSFTYAHLFQGTHDGDAMTGSDHQWEGWTGFGGDDSMDGGGGYDELLYHDETYEGGSAGITVNFATGMATDSFGDSDSFSNMEAVRATRFDDLLIGSAAQEWTSFEGLAGNDTIQGSSAYDRVDYRRDADHGGSAGIIADLAAGTIRDGFGDTDSVSGIDRVRGTETHDEIAGSGADEQLEGRGGDDTLIGGAGNDTLVDGSGDDSVSAGDGDDVLRYGGGSDFYDGGAGRDTLEIWADELPPVSGPLSPMLNLVTGHLSFPEDPSSDDRVFNIEAFHTDAALDISVLGNGADNEFLLGAGFDSVSAGFGNDTIQSRGGDDTLSDGGGDDRLEAGDGDDMVLVGTGRDYFDGGAGRDLLYLDTRSYSPGAFTLRADLITGHLSSAALPAEDDRIFNFEEVELAGGIAIEMIGNGLDNLFGGGDGDDTLNGGHGDDTLFGGDGDDRAEFYAASADVTVAHAHGGLLLTSIEGNDFVSADIETLVFADGAFSYADVAAMAPPPVINGTGTNVDGTAATEIINGTANNNWITPGGGSDTVDGGGGDDMVSFFDLPDTPGRTNLDYRLDIDLSTGSAVSHDGAERVTLIDVERITGTIFADRIKGDAGDNALRGLGDYDWFIATEGNDSYEGGTGRDTVSYAEAGAGVIVDLGAGRGLAGMAAGDSYDGIERITGSGFADTFYGDGGENGFRGLGGYDTFVGSAGGRERYDGGSGLDTVTYFQSAAGVTASLLLGYGSGGDAARDLYTSIENLTGSGHGDVLTGDHGRNILRGLSGDDFLFGNGGVDYLTGGGGDDTIDGGAGSDYALFTGDRADYTLARSGNQVTVSGADGTDLLTDVEYFRFDDQDVTIWSL